MTPERWRRARFVFESAIEHPADERRAYVAEACGGDEALRREVESLLDVYGQPGGFSMEAPLVPVALGRGAAAGGDDPRLWRCLVCGSYFGPGTPVCPNDGEVVVYAPDGLAGHLLDSRYWIERVIGTGSMGNVFLARWEPLGVQVSVKVLSPYLSSSDVWRRRFEREAAAMAKIHHPNLVQVFDHGVAEGEIVYLVQEYVDGATIRQMLGERERFRASDVARIVERIAAALDAIHGHGVVHRDVKPENVMVAGEPGSGEVKLLDLGIAKILRKSTLFSQPVTTLTLAGEHFGTPYYMAPELWTADEDAGGEDNRIDARADVYGLGALAFEMLAGRRAFVGLSIEQVREAHLTGAAEPLGRCVPGLSEAVERAVMRAISANREDRHASALEFAGDLTRAVGRA